MILVLIQRQKKRLYEASQQTVESSRKRLKNTSRAGQTEKRKKNIDKYAGIKWQKEPPIGGMKKILFIGVPCISPTTEPD